MTLPRYMMATAASSSKQSDKPRKSSRPSIQASGGVSAAKSTSSLNKSRLKNLKSILDQKSDPSRARELVKVWSKTPGILKPTKQQPSIFVSAIPYDSELDTSASSNDEDQVCREFFQVFLLFC
jgi:ABC-type Fe2+-enterobactin transport system substrate-binding protein